LQSVLAVQISIAWVLIAPAPADFELWSWFGWAGTSFRLSVPLENPKRLQP